MFGGVESRIAQLVYGIPAVKALEFGVGRTAANLRGSQCNDPFTMEKGQVRTLTNNAGGILGGITNGMPAVFRTTFKPTPLHFPTPEKHFPEPGRGHGAHCEGASRPLHRPQSRARGGGRRRHRRL